MCYQRCNNIIGNFTNYLGQKEQKKCLLEIGHKGKCSARADYQYFEYQEDKVITRLKNKIANAAINTNGATAENSPYLNRSPRYSSTPISLKEAEELKKQKKYRIGIRLDEASTFENCQEIEWELFNILNKIYKEQYDETTICPICGKQMNFEQFLYFRTEDRSIQSCHIEPLSETEIMHKPGNVKWGHRRCNLIQSDLTLPEMTDETLTITLYQITNNKMDDKIPQLENFIEQYKLKRNLTNVIL